jgi:hypothetical protein
MRGSIVVLALIASPFVASNAQRHVPKRTESPIHSAKCDPRDRGNSENAASAKGLANRADPTLKGNKKCDAGTPDPDPAPVPLTGHTSFAGSVFNDTWMANGIWDDGEPGMAGWTVQLTGTVNLTVTTGGSGEFSFDNLPAGNYTVCVVPPAGWLASLPTAGEACPGGSFGYSFFAPDLMIDVAYTDYNFGFQSR